MCDSMIRADAAIISDHERVRRCQTSATTTRRSAADPPCPPAATAIPSTDVERIRGNAEERGTNEQRLRGMEPCVRLLRWPCTSVALVAAGGVATTCRLTRRSPARTSGKTRAASLQENVLNEPRATISVACSSCALTAATTVEQVLSVMGHYVRLHV